MMCILQGLEQCKVNTWQLSLIYLLCHRSTQTCEEQASNVGQASILTQMNDFTTLKQSCSPSIDRLIRASGLFGREMKILRITGGQCCKDAEWFSTYTLVSSPHSSFRRLVCIAWANNFLNQLYCTVCGY